MPNPYPYQFWPLSMWGFYLFFKQSGRIRMVTYFYFHFLDHVAIEHLFYAKSYFFSVYWLVLFFFLTGSVLSYISNGFLHLLGEILHHVSFLIAFLALLLQLTIRITCFKKRKTLQDIGLNYIKSVDYLGRIFLTPNEYYHEAAIDLQQTTTHLRACDTVHSFVLRCGSPRVTDPVQMWLGLCFKFQIQPGGRGTSLQFGLWSTRRVFFPGLQPKNTSFLEKALLMVIAELQRTSRNMQCLWNRRSTLPFLSTPHWPRKMSRFIVGGSEAQASICRGNCSVTWQKACNQGEWKSWS